MCAASSIGETLKCSYLVDEDQLQSQHSGEDKWDELLKQGLCESGSLVVDGQGLLVPVEIQHSVKGGFGIGGQCMVLHTTGVGERRLCMESRAFWKSARRGARLADSFYSEELWNEYQFCVKRSELVAKGIAPTLLGVMLLPPRLLEKSSCRYGLVIEHLIPLSTWFGDTGHIARADIGVCSQIVAGYVQAVATLKQAGICHGDLKVSNTLLRLRKPAGTALTYTETKRRRYVAVRSQVDTVLCDFGSWRTEGGSATRNNTCEWHTFFPKSRMAGGRPWRWVLHDHGHLVYPIWTTAAIWREGQSFSPGVWSRICEKLSQQLDNMVVSGTSI
jgi:hypothetical protein